MASAHRQRADAVVRAVQAEADAITRAADPTSRVLARRMVADMRAVERQLSRRLSAIGNPEQRFSSAQALAYREQLRVAIARAQTSLQVVVDKRTQAAATRAVRHASTVLSRLERSFSGIASPVSLDAAAILGGPLGSRLAQSASSVARYGQHMIGVAERELRRGVLAGLTQSEMVDRLCSLRGGMFVQNRGWAWRIVRTEGAFAYNAAHHAAIEQQQREMPDLQKKILAMLDARTAYDSVAVHGQIRDLNDDFVDGAGRVYPFPPARPNDREVIIPWRPHWDETTTTAPLPAHVVAQARDAQRPGTTARHGRPARPAPQITETPEQVVARIVADQQRATVGP